MTLPKTIAPTFNSRAGERWFYAMACLAAFAVVIGGFGHTAYVRQTSGRPGLPPLVAVHASLMAGWYVLFLVQVTLIRTDRRDLHQRFGWFFAAWAALMIVSGVMAVRLRETQLLQGEKSVAGPPSTYWLLVMLAAFALLVGGAILLRRKRDYHKRLMLLSCYSLALAGVSRLPFGDGSAAELLQGGGLGGAFGLDLLMVYAWIAWDTWRNRRLHPAFVFGTLVIVMQDTLMLKTAGWIRLFARLTG